MPMTRPPYSSGFREQMVELVRSGRSPEELAREFEPSAQSIRNWVGQADRDEGRSHDGLTSAEREELRRLRRENRRLRQEREILAKAAAWFARETGSIPSGSSSSKTGPQCAGCWGSPPLIFSIPDPHPIARELSVRYRAGRRRARYRPSFRADASFRTFRCAQPFVQLRPAPASRRVAHRDGHRLLFGIVV